MIDICHLDSWLHRLCQTGKEVALNSWLHRLCQTSKEVAPNSWPHKLYQTDKKVHPNSWPRRLCQIDREVHPNNWLHRLYQIDREVHPNNWLHRLYQIDRESHSNMLCMWLNLSTGHRVSCSLFSRVKKEEFKCGCYLCIGLMIDICHLDSWLHRLCQTGKEVALNS